MAWANGDAGAGAIAERYPLGRFGLLGYEPSTLEDVGREIGLTRERVRQIQVEALRRLKDILQQEGLSTDSLFNQFS